ncbi:MAG: hypothetical protein JWN78_133 [Bacteroidota bacterium]|nr:hypothetical protein [Bacteroidota bacterium]
MTAELIYNEAMQNMYNFSLVLDEQSVIPESQHKEDVSQMKKNLKNEYFFFVVNLAKHKIEHAHGISRWLGYPDNSFTFKNYIYIMHPSQYMTLGKIGGNILQTLFKHDYDIKYLTHRFISNTVLKHADGNYLLFKRISSPWQWDKNKKLSAYLNEFYLLGAYDGETFNPRSANVHNTHGVESTVESDVRETIRNNSEEYLPFTTQQYRILRILAYNPELKEDEVGSILSISVNTVHTHAKNILPLARDYFSRPFSTTKEVASFIRKEGLL